MSKEDMSERKTVVIKGVVYDVATGKPLNAARPQHTIQKFAPHQGVIAKPKMMDIAPVHHPVVAKVHAKQAANNQVRTLKTSDIIKNEAIADAMERTVGRSRTPVEHKKTIGKAHKAMRIATAAAALLLLGGYLTYLNMPALSTRIAAMQAGIDATYPTYTPNGYRLSEPVAYKNGMVAIKFAANASPQQYSITEERSTWDSTAVRENYIQPQVGESYVVTQANGLTIYTYGQNAAWVNGGILYTISGNAPLSSEQVQRIAISM